MRIVSSFPGEDGLLVRVNVDGESYATGYAPNLDGELTLGPNMSAFLTKAGSIMAEVLETCKREGQARRRDYVIGASHVGS